MRAPGPSLLSCIGRLCAPEPLEGDSQYFCDTCKGKRDATKRLQLHRLPAALVMHVNRAQWGVRSTGRKEKTQTHVVFPLHLEVDDLRECLSAEARAAYGVAATSAAIHAGNGRSEAAAVGAASAASAAAPPAAATSPRYRLQAVVVHIGRGIDTGHYVAYCYDAPHDTWLLHDDHTVKVVFPAEVQRAQAYLLVYERLAPAPVAAGVA